MRNVQFENKDQLALLSRSLITRTMDFGYFNLKGTRKFVRELEGTVSV